MIKEAIVLAGGLGTRLREVVRDKPKPMVDINRRPFLEYLLSYLHEQGISRIILAVGYRWEIIRNYFGNKFKNLEILYSVETIPLGTGGAIKLALELIESEDVFILNGDTFFNINLMKLMRFHKEKNSPLTLALKKMKNFDRYGVIEIDENYRIKNFLEKKYTKEGLINGGIYILNKDFFLNLELPDKFSFEKDFLEKYYETYSFYGFPFENYFIDIGIPEDYERAKRDFEKLKY